jgi:hypothetical protein
LPKPTITAQITAFIARFIFSVSTCSLLIRNLVGASPLSSGQAHTASKSLLTVRCVRSDARRCC